jgi:hypothetical protein
MASIPEAKERNYMKLVFSVLFFSLLGASAEAKYPWWQVPLLPVERMTCQEAVAFNAKYGRFYVTVEGNKLVPIYKITPKEKWWPHSCGHKKVSAAYIQRTQDKKSCVIGYYCHPR